MARLRRMRLFRTQLDQAVFKLEGIVVLGHQSTSLKWILFKEGSIFHLPCAEYFKAVSVFNKLLLKADIILNIVRFCSFSTAKG